MPFEPNSGADRARRLARLAAGLRDGSMDTAERVELASMLDQIADGADPDRVLGVARLPGQRSISTMAAIERRDALLRKWRDHFHASEPDAAAAEAIHTVLNRYSTAGWLHERVETECPTRLLGSEREFAWRVLRIRDYALSERSIRAILAAN